MKRVLVLSGGGAKLMAEIKALQVLESRTKKRICEMFDLIVGTSAGAIIGGIMASGVLTANDALDIMRDTLPNVFKRKFLGIILKDRMYDRSAVRKSFAKYVGNIKMKDCKTRLMTTSVSVMDKTTHYFKSWEKKDGELALIDVVERSFAAPIYFGFVDDPANMQVWADGGTGINNIPSTQAIVEAIRQGWHHEQCHFLIVGCLYHSDLTTYKPANEFGTAEQGELYLDPADGGLARQQSREFSISVMSGLVEGFEHWSMQYVDKEVSKDMDQMDAIKYMDQYERFGEDMGNRINVANLI